MCSVKRDTTTIGRAQGTLINLRGVKFMDFGSVSLLGDGIVECFGIIKAVEVVGDGRVSISKRWVPGGGSRMKFLS